MKWHSRLADVTSRTCGRPIAFLAMLGLTLVWAATGPIFHYSDTWQLVINTGTTIVTCLMTFLIQGTQNRDSAAVQAKLDELIRASNARNEFIGLDREDLEAIEARRGRGARGVATTIPS